LIYKSLLFAAGCFSISFLPSLPPLWLLLCVTTFILILLVLRKNDWVVFFFLGLAWGCFYGGDLLQSQLPAEQDGLEFVVEGQVVDLPQQTERRSRFRLQVDSIKAVLPSVTSPDLNMLLLSCYESCPELRPGQFWRMLVKLKRPRGFMNKGGFNYRLWLLQSGVSATGYVRNSSSQMELLNKYRIGFDSFRFYIKQKILQANVSDISKALLLALSIGDGQKFSPQDWKLLRVTGTIHLMVISGLHIGLVALIFYVIGTLIGRLVNHCLPRIPALYIALPCSVIGAWLFAGLSGFGLPSVRALVMISVVYFFKIRRISVPHFTSLVIALAVIAVFEPLAIQGSGFWLSFGAVWVLIFVFGSITGVLHWTGKWFWPQWVVFVGLSVLLLLFFGQLPLLSPLVNMVAVPVVSLLVVPFCLLAVVSLFFYEQMTFFIWHYLDYLLLLLWDFLLWCDLYCKQLMFSLPLQLSFFDVIILISACIVLLLPKGFPARYLALLPFLSLFSAESNKPVLTLSVLDVGQGLATVIQTQSHVLVYDTGVSYGDTFSTGGSVVAPYLRSQGVGFIDRVIISHGDNDHAGGLSGLLEELNVGEIFSGEALSDNNIRRKEFSTCVRGIQWQWDNVQFEILSPFTDNLFQKRNNRSCVLLVSIDDERILLPGDIEKKMELLIQQDPQLSDGVSILLAPHHGSQTSSSPGFVSVLKPEHVVYSAGYKHHFGHPHKQVSKRYDQMGSKSWNTANDGAITFEWTGKEWRVESMRKIDQKYWQN